VTLNVGLTGNVASGKSSVSDVWRSRGVPVLSADELAREAVRPGSEGLRRVVETFGNRILASDGSLDRAALRGIVFRDEEARRKLEAIIHPEVWRLREAWLAEQRASVVPIAVSEIPLLFETGREEAFDRVVFVDAPESLRLERMVRDRGLAPDEARRIAAAQMDPAEKRRRSDYVIDNGGDLEQLRGEALRVLELLRRDAAGTGEADQTFVEDADPRVGPGDAASGAGPGSPRRMRIDLHLHSWASWDCLSDPEEILERALQRGLDRIAITDHNRLDLALEMAARHPDRVIPGEEVKTAEGIDVIGLYLKEEIPRGTPAREVIRRTREQGGIPYLPHPYAGGKGGGGRFAEELAPLVDVVEAFNARIHSAGPNQRAAELARRHGKLSGAGSDAHTVGEVGGAFVELPSHRNEPGALLEALRDARVAGKSSSHLVHLASTWAKLRKRLPGWRGPPS
jgi:dephospho-CoA kinase